MFTFLSNLPFFDIFLGIAIVVSLAANSSRAAPTTGYSHTNAGRWSVAYLQAQQDAKCAGDTCKVRPQKLYIRLYKLVCRQNPHELYSHYIPHKPRLTKWWLIMGQLVNLAI